MPKELIIDETDIKDLKMSEYEIAVGWAGRKADEQLEMRKVTGFMVSEHLAVRDMENGNGWAIDHLPTGRRLNHWPLLTFQTVVLYAKAIHKYLHDPGTKNAEIVYTEDEQLRMQLYMKYLIVNPESETTWDEFKERPLPEGVTRISLHELNETETKVTSD